MPMTPPNGKTAILLLHSPLRQGIAASLTEFIYEHGGHIVGHDQHVDPENQLYFSRVEWSMEGFGIAEDDLAEVFEHRLARPYQMTWQLHFSDEVYRMAIFVSRASHCFFDILSRHQSGEWNVEIPLVISNHPDLEPAAHRAGIDFHCLPIGPDNKQAQEVKQLALLEEKGVDFIVLARYMQILSGAFISHYVNRIINIHHSFLPAFKGARPYHAAHARGVKLVGATAHYVTEELDDGPIIEQGITRITHTNSIDDLIRKGRDVERLTLARAIWCHIQRRIIVSNGRTVVFSD